MQILQPRHQEINRADRSADQTEAFPLNRAAYATAVAQAEFGAAYAPPHQAEWRDRSPAEIAIIRASIWGTE